MILTNVVNILTSDANKKGVNIPICIFKYFKLL